MNLEPGGPGQETIKKYEVELIKQINSLIQQVSIENPGKEVRLKIAGHSLGGALAKYFAHTLQRAIAVQKNEAHEIIEHIKKELPTETQTLCQSQLQELEKKLENNQKRFQGNKGLNKVKGITVYGMGAPGVSAKTDENGTLMTYYHAPDFLRIYNHFHSEDIITKFGEQEFLSGKLLPPRILVHQEIQFTTNISQKEIDESPSLPFPGISKRVMAAHDKQIYSLDAANVRSTVSEIGPSSALSEKFTFSYCHRKLYEIIFLLAKFIASFKFIANTFNILDSWTAHEIAKPDIVSEKTKERAAQKIQTLFRQHNQKKQPEPEKVEKEQDVKDSSERNLFT